RPEDEKPQSEAEPAGDAQTPDRSGGAEGEAAQHDEEEGDSDVDEEVGDQTLSDVLVRDLTAHRTLGLRLNLSDHPEIAIIAVTHALAAQTFYIGADVRVVGIQPVKTDLAAHADGIEDSPAGKAWADRHANWA
ncbi:UNVERIFIED_CONTAM: chromosome partitioning protein ParB, partial [Bacteroidetes bacterium 56_B9]